MIYEAKLASPLARTGRSISTGANDLKTAIRGSFENTLDEQLALEAKLQGKCGKTHDFQEGVMAFLEKRPAKLEGH